MEKKFKVGQHVSWSSQSHGISKYKTGYVLHIVPAWQSGHEILKASVLDVKKSYRQEFDPSQYTTRNHESYLVLVDSGSELRKPRVYWPLVRHLQECVEAGAEQSA